MNCLSSEAQSLTWLVNNFVAEVPGVTHAVMLSADGLLLIASDGLSAERAQQLSVAACGARSLAETAARLFDLGQSSQTIVRMERGYLFIMAISDGSCLATLARAGCDMENVAYQMTLLVEGSGHQKPPGAETPPFRAGRSAGYSAAQSECPRTRRRACGGSAVSPLG